MHGRVVGWGAARIYNRGDTSSQVAEAAALFTLLHVPLTPPESAAMAHKDAGTDTKDHTCMRVPQALKQAYSQGYPESAMHVQESIGSRNSAIHNDYHTSLRPSSVLEPRYPSLKVVTHNMSQNRSAETCQGQLSQSKHNGNRNNLGHRAAHKERHALPGCPATRELPHGGSARGAQPSPPSHSHRKFTLIGLDSANDPSAGSPTETLLRLLLPLSDKVH